MANKPKVIYERHVVLNKVLAIPDRRFKSGYRSKEVVGTAQALLPDQADGTELALDHIHKLGKQFVQTQAFSDIRFPLELAERQL